MFTNFDIHDLSYNSIRNTNSNRNAYDSSLNFILNELNQQRNMCITLMQQNANLRNAVENMIIDQMSTNRHQPTQQPQPIRQTHTDLLTSDEIHRNTSAVIYAEISNPLNNRCPLTGNEFRPDEYVCRLPCGHLFDGRSICYHLTRVSSKCPICNVDVKMPTASPPPPQTTQQSARQIPPRSNNTNTLLSNAIDDLFIMTFQNYDPNLINPLRTNSTTTTNNLRTTDTRTVDSTSELFNIIQNLMTPQNLNSNIPTQAEIQTATETVLYGTIENPPDDCCPISYEEFEDETTVTRIKHCGHIFSSEHLTRWFATNSKCPVCRHDIKSQTPENRTQSRSANSHYTIRYRYTE